MDKINNIGLSRLLTSVYDFDGFNEQEVWCRIAQKINIIIEHFNYLDKKIENEKENNKAKFDYLLGEGLTEAVAKIILEKIKDGTIGELINNTLLKDINDKVDMNKTEYTTLIADKESYINIEDYKQFATNNDYSQALDYILENIVDNINNFTIIFNKNKTYILNNKINKKYVTLTGGATIDGLLEIGLTDEELNGEWYDTFMNCKITDLTFNPATNKWNTISDTKGIRLKNAKDVKINKCTFKNLTYPIKLLTRNNAKSGHTVRIFITDNNFFNVGYNLYSESSEIQTLDGFFEYGDITFNNNLCQETKTANIILSRQDGFVCQGNTFFMERVSYNIFLDKSTIINISNNQLFEAGDSSIYLKNCYVANVNSNNIYWASKESKKSCILVEGTNCWGDNKLLITINGNIIEKPYGNGIEILRTTSTHSQGVVISNNIIYLRDTENYKAIVNNNEGLGTIINNNVVNGKCTRTEISTYATSTQNSILDSRTMEYKNINEQWLNNDGTPTISYNCKNYITLTSGSVTTVSDLLVSSSIQRGTEVIIANPSTANKIIKNSSKIKTRSGTDITLLPNTLVRFIYNNDVFCEY